MDLIKCKNILQERSTLKVVSTFNMYVEQIHGLKNVSAEKTLMSIKALISRYFAKRGFRKRRVLPLQQEEPIKVD